MCQTNHPHHSQSEVKPLCMQQTWTSQEVKEELWERNWWTPMNVKFDSLEFRPHISSSKFASATRRSWFTWSKAAWRQTIRTRSKRRCHQVQSRWGIRFSSHHCAIVGHWEIPELAISMEKHGKSSKYIGDFRESHAWLQEGNMRGDRHPIVDGWFMIVSTRIRRNLEMWTKFIAHSSIVLLMTCVLTRQTNCYDEFSQQGP